MKAFAKIAIAATAFVSTLAVAGPFDQGMVGGSLKSTVRIENVTQDNRATLGYASQELNVGSVNGGKALGSVQFNVQAKNISQTNRATLAGAAGHTVLPPRRAHGAPVVRRPSRSILQASLSFGLLQWRHAHSDHRRRHRPWPGDSHRAAPGRHDCGMVAHPAPCPGAHRRRTRLRLA
ncbi:MAG: hypothetical protein ACK4KV_17480 [Rhodocyclaceae bacterium]